MGTTADKLTYLNTTKGKIKDSINLTGAGITNQDTFRSYASLLKTGLISIINNGIDQLYSNFPKVSGTGSNLSLTPTYEAPMRSEIYYGDTLQNGTPTPSSPIDIQTATGLQNINITGKNLFDINNSGGKTQCSFNITGNNLEITSSTTGNSYIYYDVPVKTNSTYNISCTAVADNVAYCYIRGYKTNGTYDTLLDFTDATNLNAHFNTDTNTSYLRIYLYATRVNSGGSSGNKTTYSNIQLEKGSTATTYEPYKGNTYEVNLGKNLFDKNNITNGKRLYYWQGTANLIDDANYCVSDYINVFENSVYTINLTMSAYTRMIFYDNSKNPLSANETNATFTTPDNTAYVRLSVPLNQLNTTQLEKGATATEYSEYFTPIELCKINTYQDSIKKSTGKNLFDKDNANIFNGYLNGNEGIVSNNNNRITYIQIENDKTYTISKVLSNRFRIGLTNSVPSNNLQINDYSSQDNQTSYTFTNTSYKYLCIWFWTNTDTLTEQRILDSIMIEENNQATSYEPYGKVWYIEKNINKKIFNGSNSDGTWAKQTGYYNCNANLGGIAGQGYTNYYSYGNLINENKFLITTNAFRVNDSTDTLENYITWLSTHNIELYYVSNTPTYTEITNTELLEDLENLYNANSKNGTTNINVSSEYLPFILNISALEMTD